MGSSDAATLAWAAAWVIGLVFVIFLLVRANRRAAAARQAEAAKKQAEIARQQAWAQDAIRTMEAADGDILKLTDLSSQVEGLVLHADERCFAAAKGAAHITEAHRTSYIGGSQGVSFRIVKGVRYHVGGFSGHPVTTTFEKVADVGAFYVTTQRAVFAGSKEVSSVAAGKIADVRIDGAKLWLIAENRKTPLCVLMTEPVVPVMAYAVRLLAESAQQARAGRR